MKKPKTYNLKRTIYDAISKLAAADGRSDSDWLNIHLGNTLPTKEVSKPKMDIAVVSENKTELAISNKFSNDDLEFSKWFYSRLLILNPSHKKPNLNAWADVIRLIRETDKRTYQQMSDLFLWVNADDFWKGNILSPAKLRKQWDTLVIQMNKVSAPKKAAQDVIDVLNDTSWADNMNLDDAF